MLDTLFSYEYERAFGCSAVYVFSRAPTGSQYEKTNEDVIRISILDEARGIYT